MNKINEIESSGLSSQDISTDVRPENVVAVVTDRDKFKKKKDQDKLFIVKDKNHVLEIKNLRRWKSIKEKLKPYKKLIEKIYKINDKLIHKKSNVNFIISSKENDKYWLYPEGKNPNDKNAMLLSSKEIDKYFK